MQAKAKLSSLRIAPRKVRLVADLIRGLDVKVAQDQLSVMNRRAVKPLLKLLNSVIANAENNFKLKKDNLYIEEIRVDGGSIIKRWMPRAQGRAARINKRTSHINIILEERVKTDPSADGKETKKANPSDNEKDKKDVKIVKSFEEVKEIPARQSAGASRRLAGGEKDEKKVPTLSRDPELQSDIGKKGGGVKRMFRRKSV